MKGKKGMNLAAVVVAIIFMLVYTVPTIRHAAKVDECAAQNLRWDAEAESCV